MSQWFVSCFSKGAAGVCDVPLAIECYMNGIVRGAKVKMLDRRLWLILEHILDRMESESAVDYTQSYTRR